MKKVIALFMVSILMIACNNKKVSSVDSHQEIKVDSTFNNLSIEKNEDVLLYKSENIKVYGDKEIDSNKISRTIIKFEPYVGFGDYKVEKIDHSKVRQVDLKSNEDARMFRTNLREEFKSEKANFAGHYSFASWGCGSNCQMSLVIDRLTGKVYDAPAAAGGFDFKVESRMVIVNPPDSLGYYYDDCFYCKPMIYFFDEQKKVFNEIKPNGN